MRSIEDIAKDYTEALRSLASWRAQLQLMKSYVRSAETEVRQLLAELNEATEEQIKHGDV